MIDDSLPIPKPAEPCELLRASASALSRGLGVVIATVTARRGSSPATPGQKLLLVEDNSALGTVGGGALERKVLGAMRDAMRGSLAVGVPPVTLSLNLGSELGMCCGGSVDLMLEAIAPARPIGIVGAGHVATALAPLLARLGFAVTIADAREAWTEPSRLNGVTTVCGEFSDLGGLVPSAGAVLVMSHDHQLDQAAIEWALRQSYCFVGAIGSRAKCARTRSRLEARGFSTEDISRVRMPLGVSIGARLPEEIAVSIAGEMIAWRSGFDVPAGLMFEAKNGPRGQ